MTSSAHEKSRPHGWRPDDTLGGRLVLIRRTLGLSQRDAAARCGIPFGQWQGMEDDHRQVRGLDRKIRLISRHLDVDLDWLMWGGRLNDPWAADKDGDRRPDDDTPGLTQTYMVGNRTAFDLAA